MLAHFSASHCRIRRTPKLMLCLFSLSIITWTGFVSVPLQAQTFPRTRIELINPPGGKVGTTVEAVITGADIDEVKELIFSDSRIKAEFLPPPAPDPKDKKKQPTPPPKFKITIPGDMPLGAYDARVVGKWGISNPRAFMVGDLNEILEKEPNNDVPQAQLVPMNTTINAIINSNTDVDYFQFDGKKDQKIVIRCDASNIDSKLNPQLEVYSEKGKKLAINRNYLDRNSVASIIVPEDGKYYVRLSSFAYLQGGNDSFYRCSITEAPWIDAVYPSVVEAGKANNVTLIGRNLPSGQVDPTILINGKPGEKAEVSINPPAEPLQQNEVAYSLLQLPSLVTVEGFEYRAKNGAGTSNPVLLTYSKFPVILDNQDNDSEEKAQRVTLPATVCGKIEKAGDRDIYVFTAKKGDVYSFEAIADRFGLPINLFYQIRRMDNKQIMASVYTHPEIPDFVNNYPVLSEDPKSTFTAPADGDYQIIVSSATAYSQYGARFIYRLNLYKQQPDFDVLLVSNNTANAGGITVHQGGSQEMEVILIRKDGFDNEVLLEAEGLPGDVVCQPQVIGPKLKQSVLVLQAKDNAKDWAGSFKVKATATVDGKKVTRYVRTGCVVWPTPNNVPVMGRISRTICLSVREKGPFALAVDPAKIEVPVGGNFEVKVKSNRNWKEMKDQQIQLVRLTAPAQTNGTPINTPNTNIDKGKDEATVKVNLPTNAVPGEFELVLQGKAKFQYQPDPMDKKKRNVDVYQATPPVKVIVYDKVAEMSVNTPKVEIKPDQEVELVIKAKRLYDYKGELNVQIVVPNGFSGLSVANTKIPANQDEVKIKIKAAKNAKAQSNPNFIVRAQARVGNVTFTHETTFAVTITAATVAAKDF